MALALATASLGLALLGLAAPRTAAAWLSIRAQPALDALQNGKQPSDVDLKEGIGSLIRAIAWTPSARRFTDLALLQLEQAERLVADDAAKQALLAQAEERLVLGLKANPASGFAWLRLAIIRELRGGQPHLVASALMQSLDVAPSMRKLWLPRAIMLLAYWRYLTTDELMTMRAQLRTIWIADKAMRLPLMQFAYRSGQLPLIVWAIGDDPPALAEFEQIRSSLAGQTGR